MPWPPEWESVWYDRDSRSPGPGLLFYGIRQMGKPRRVVLPISLWPQGTAFRLGDRGAFHGQRWDMTILDVELRAGWGTRQETEEAVAATLSSLVREGCDFAWAASEGWGRDPPDVFASDSMVGPALCCDGFAIWPDDWTAGWLNESQLKQLRQHAGSMAAAT